MGIIDQATGATPPQAPQGPVQGDPAQAPGNEGEGDQATPEEQEAYERVVLAGMQALYDEKTAPQFIQMLSSGADNPADAIAKVTATLITQLDEQSGGQIPETVVLPAAAELLTLVAEIAADNQLFPVEQNTVEKAGQLMVTQVAESYGVEPQEIEELLQSYDQSEIQGMVAQQQQIADGGQAPTGQPAPAGGPPV